MKARKRFDERLARLPKELREPPVALAAVSLIAPLFIVLLGVAAGQSEVSSPLYTLAAIVFVVALIGFIVTSIRRYRVQRLVAEAEAERRNAERARLRKARRLSAERLSDSRTETETTPADARRAS
jgi:ABC-type siderophore export system fused ATPase/permease subunit